MNILVSGSRGLIGSALVAHLTSRGHVVRCLVRGEVTIENPGVRWDPVSGSIDVKGLDGIDAVVHLAGESISNERWSAAKKARIRDSRVAGTRFLCETLAGLEPRPRVLVSASAAGYYGDRGDELLREESPAGSDFLADVCRQWEAATEPASRAGVRVVLFRMGIVLSARGGALGRMLPIFRKGLGGKIGSGRQYWSWVAIDDLLPAIEFAINTSTMEGPVNVVSPNPVTNVEFSNTLGRALSRPVRFSLPASVARLAFGEVADVMLLSSARLEPAKLLATGFSFRHPDLEGALRAVLAKG